MVIAKVDTAKQFEGLTQDIRRSPMESVMPLPSVRQDVVAFAFVAYGPAALSAAMAVPSPAGAGDGKRGCYRGKSLHQMVKN